MLTATVMPRSEERNLLMESPGIATNKIRCSSRSVVAHGSLKLLTKWDERQDIWWTSSNIN